MPKIEEGPIGGITFFNFMSIINNFRTRISNSGQPASKINPISKPLHGPKKLISFLLVFYLVNKFLIQLVLLGRIFLI